MLDQITLYNLQIGILSILVLILILIIAVLFYSFHKFKVSQDEKKWTEIIQRKITDVIVEGSQDVHADLAFESYVKQQSFRNLFLSVLIASNRRFAGHAQNEVFGLFHSFGLENDAWKKVKKKEPYLISGGIQELTTMKVDNVVPMLSKLLNHPNKQVYQEAQYSLVNFKGFEGLFFLDTLQKSLSDWQQIRLLQSIRTVNDEVDERILNWLNHENKSVVIFTLRIISQFQLLSYYDYIVKLLEDKPISIRKQAIMTLQALENRDTITLMMDIFDTQPLEVQIEIMGMLKASRGVQTKAFLKEQLYQNPETRIKILAAEILALLQEGDYLQSIISDENTPNHLTLIIKHALQERI